MRMTNRLCRIIARVGAGVVIGALVTACQPQESSPGLEIDNDDIGGVVASENGPEAGVWVIAETSDLDTRFVRIVVTDDQGRYVIPDLPEANYSVWVRGYGLADSARVDASPGEIADLTAVVAPDPATAAQVYPAAYWYSMMALPEESELGNIPDGLKGYLASMKNIGCVGCHQLGQLSTRTIPKELGEFESSEDAWMRRIQSGQAGRQMAQQVTQRLDGLPLKYLADWTDRVAAGELPSTQPERPTGIERNVVATVPGLGESHRLYARFDIHRPAQPHCQWLRPDLWISGAQHRRLSDPRSGWEHRHRVPGDSPRCGYAHDRQHSPVGGIALLG